MLNCEVTQPGKKSLALLYRKTFLKRREEIEKEYLREVCRVVEVEVFENSVLALEIPELVLI